MGCPRNLVDSEVLLGILRSSGYEITDISEADIGIVNTCAFIEDAKRESIDMILEFLELKKSKRLSSVIVAGCLPQRYGETLLKGFPEVDAFIGCDQIAKIADVIRRAERERLCEVSDSPTFLYDHTMPRIFITPPHSIYVKISEGCENRCSFCAIPSIKGVYRSRPIESILKEVETLSNRQKISEINLIGQDTTYYGKDIYGQPMITELLKRLCTFRTHRRWIRLLYTYPSHIDDGLINLLAHESSLCNYIDVPIQHINNTILGRMNRKMHREDIIRLIEKLRSNIPSLVLRSSVIVGFPGETQKEFEELLAFVKEVRFERLGVFTYSREEGTPAFRYREQVPEEVKLERFNLVMAAQKEIAEEINRSFLGKRIEVLIDEKDENAQDIYIGRTQGDAPEVDGEVFVKTKNTLKGGDFVNVKVTDTLDYDLVAEEI